MYDQTTYMFSWPSRSCAEKAKFEEEALVRKSQETVVPVQSVRLPMYDWPP